MGVEVSFLMKTSIADFGSIKLLGSGAQMLSRVNRTRGTLQQNRLLELGKGMHVSTTASFFFGGGGVEVYVEMPDTCSAETMKEKLTREDCSWLLEFVEC